MPLYLFFTVFFFNIKETNKPSINSKSPTVSEIFQKFNNNLNNDPIEITYVIDGCDYLMIYKISLTKIGNQYSLKLSLPPKSQDVLHDFKKLMKQVRYYKTYKISYQKLRELESAFEPRSNIRSTTGNYLAIKYCDDSLNLSDRSGGDEFSAFIYSLCKTRF